jgi:hypothetical protein
MNNWASLARAVRGPIILITLGVLFAIDHFGPLSFSRTWPILIIVIGLMKLIERSSRVQQAPQSNVAPSGNFPGGLPR